MKTNRQSGFTIVELIVVVVILGLLTTIGAVGYTTVQKFSHDEKRKSDVTLIKNELKNYYRDNGEYPLYSHAATPFLDQNAWDFLKKHNIKDPTDLVGANTSDGTRLESGLCKQEAKAYNNCPNYGYLTTSLTSGSQGADFWSEKTTYVSPITGCTIQTQTRRHENGSDYPNPWYVVSWFSEVANTVLYTTSNSEDVKIQGTDGRTGKPCAWENI